MNHDSQSIDAVPETANLEKRPLDWRHVTVLSMAGCGPASVIALNVHVMGTFAHASLVLSFIFVWPGILLIANTFGEFAKRLPTAGGLYTWNVHAWGKNFGFVYGWTLIGAYLVFSSAGFAVLGGWVHEWFLQAFSVDAPWWIFTIGGLGYIAILAYLGVVQSIKAMIFFLFTEIILLLVLALWVVFSGGGPSGISSVPFTISGANTAGLAGIIIAVPFAILSHVGIEEGATLGQEMPRPRRSIASGIWLTAIIVPIFYIFVSYALVLGFGIDRMGADWANTDAPLQSVASSIWGPAGLSIVSFSAAISILAFSQGAFMAGVRVLFTLGREGVLPKRLGKTTKFGTPGISVIVTCIIVAVLAFPLAFAVGPFHVWNYFGFLISIAFTVSYICTHAGLIRYTLKIGEFNFLRHGVFGSLGALIFIYPLVSTVYPAPQGSYQILPYIYIIWVLIGLMLLLYTRHYRPDVITAVGTSISEAQE